MHLREHFIDAVNVTNARVSVWCRKHGIQVRGKQLSTVSTMQARVDVFATWRPQASVGVADEPIDKLENNHWKIRTSRSGLVCGHSALFRRNSLAI